jgi:LytR cell envelope-related transcriptional attenuator
VRGIRVRAAAIRLLRLGLPACVVAASCVALLGLFRVVSRPAAEPASQQAPSLRLGSDASPAPRNPVASRRPSLATPAEGSSTPPPRALTASVAVFNASGIEGLAGQMATTLQQEGVTVASIGNFNPQLRPAVATVYYPPGIRAQAQTLARLSGAPMVSPAPGWLETAGRLVLVVTSSPTAAEPAAAHHVS